VPVIGVSFGYTPVPMAELGPDLLLDSYDELRPEMAETLVAKRAQRRRRAMAAKRKPLAAVS